MRHILDTDLQFTKDVISNIVKVDHMIGAVCVEIRPRNWAISLVLEGVHYHYNRISMFFLLVVALRGLPFTTSSTITNQLKKIFVFFSRTSSTSRPSWLSVRSSSNEEVPR